LQELWALLVPRFGPAKPDTGTVVVPTFRYGVVPAGASNDGFFVPSGVFLARSGAASGGSGFRLTSPLSVRWSGTASTPPAQLTWQAGTLFGNVFNGATGGFVPFRIVSGGSPESDRSPSSPSDLPIAAEPADEDPGQQDGGEVFRTALLPLAGVAVAWRCSRRLRQRLHQAR
jgi:hypothetical protein